LDWLKSWETASGILPNNSIMYSGSWTDGAPGTWSVTSDQGSSGVKHTVSGTATCGSSSSSATGLDTSTVSNNKNCWCRMTAPNLGASWVFSFADSSSAFCASGCAYYCAYCVLNGTIHSCSRSAVLALP
jgi:hypothetical protein